ncbi:MAG: PEGA domain-containing protein, partial [Deltaproteobacteria bacterium]|nr:PEGA domain-containing protein [Deltaproteobacteria bacterium]
APREGYEPFTQTLTVEPKGEAQTVQGSLIPIIFKGKVAIATDPAEGVQVYMDDVPVGVTPVKDIELDTGKRYLFRFEKEGYDRWVRYIEVYRDEVVELKPVMERATVGRTVVSKPPSAALRLP